MENEMAEGKQSRAEISSAPTENRVGDFESLGSILDAVLADLEAAVMASGGFHGDVLPQQRPLSVAIDRVVDAQPEAAA